MPTMLPDLQNLLRGLPIGDLVAFSESRNEVVAHGVDREAVLAESASKGEDHPLIVRVLDPTMMFY